MPKRIGNLDTLVESARVGLRKSGEYGDFVDQVWSGSDNLYIRISKDQVSRALRIMNVLVLAIKARGNLVRISNGKTYMVVGEIEIAFSLKEQSTRKLTKKPFEWIRLVPTGKLYFDEGEYYPQKVVGDTNVPLEDKLYRVLAKLELKARKWAEWRRKSEEADRKRKIQEQKEQEQRRIWENEMNGMRKLISESERYNLVQLLRDYVDEYERRFLESNHATDAQIHWVSWARKKIEWYDPLIQAEDEVLSAEDRDRVAEKEDQHRNNNNRSNLYL